MAIIFTPKTTGTVRRSGRATVDLELQFVLCSICKFKRKLQMAGQLVFLVRFSEKSQ